MDLFAVGTTSKQIATETDCKPIGYGAMLLEGFVAIIALGTIMIASKAEIAGLKPDAVYSLGLGRFLTSIIGEQHVAFATTFAAMALSTFIFDTIDVGTRLGRYILQELFRWEGRIAAAVCTGLTVGVPMVVLLGTGSGSFRTFWTLFGSSNQLLAGLTLLAVTCGCDAPGGALVHAGADAVRPRHHADRARLQDYDYSTRPTA